MSYEKLLLNPFPEAHVWSRGSGDLIIVVIDDECYSAPECPELVDPDVIALPRLREHALKLSETRAIGFFPLAEDEDGADKMLEFIHEKWLKTIITPDTRIYFLIDSLFGYGPGATDVAAPRTVKKLIETYSYPPDHIRYFTRAGSPRVPLDVVKNFIKANEADYIQREGKFSQKLMSFFGQGYHDSKIISDAIQFYAKAWEADWPAKGWQHDCLETQESEQLKALDRWLGFEANTLYDLDDGDSAKALMIWGGDDPDKVWRGEDLWEDPSWEERSRRRIYGKVLNAVFKKLDIPLADLIPDYELVTMPCVPCFPFLVSLRSFLWRCKNEGAPVSEVHFFRLPLSGNAQANLLRLTLPLKDSSGLARKFVGEERQGGFTRSLIDLTRSRAHKLKGPPLRRDYMDLFRDGTRFPIVAVEIVPSQINLIWTIE